MTTPKQSSSATGDDKHVTATLELRNKLYQQSVLDRFGSIDWARTSSAPFVVEFDPTTACNLACPDCISRDLLNQGYFTRERIRDLTREMIDAGVKAVVLIGGGEPLAHPEIGWVMEELARNGVRIGLTTNGLLIHRYLDVIAEKVDWVRVSVDAGTAATFQKLRPSPTGKSMFDEVLRNMELLAPRRKGKLGYSYMIYSEGMFEPSQRGNRFVVPLQPAFHPDGVASMPFNNVAEIYEAAGIAKRIGCDYFELKPMYDINHFLILQNRELMRQAEQLAERAKTLGDEKFKVLLATKLKDLFSGQTDVERKDYTRCAVAQMRTLVTPSGVYVCPYFRGRDDKRIGDVTKVSFAEMWQGEDRRRVMEKLNPSVDCKMHCIRHESNLVLEDMIAGKVRPAPVDDFDLFI